MATREEKEAALQKHQFEVLLKKIQSEATLGRVRNLHPGRRHKLKHKLEKTYEEKLSEPPDQKKEPPEMLWKVYDEKEEIKRAEKMKRVRALAGK
ncbi:hypothetical protein MPTK1_4g03635 [Marchantia polymorpha subsp. ruderalis]